MNKKLYAFFEKNTKALQIVYVIVLALYPFWRINQGLSVIDTLYSVSNFAYFSEMNGTWMVATYLANVVGSMFFKFPWGDTLLGMNFYTSIIVSLTAVSAFVYLKREIPSHVLFLGEMIALGLCWCPTTILYNYLTYLIFTLGALTLYRGVCGGRDDCFVAAGILLGLNVSTRFPNITEAALIVVVWYVAIIEKKQIKRVVVETLMCMGGYLLGFIIPIIIITIRYTSTAYIDMIHNLFAMTDKATDYKPTSMITAMFEDYVYAKLWLFVLLIGTVAAAVVYFVFDRIEVLRKIRGLKTIVSSLIMLVCVRFCFGRGMFSLRYAQFGSVYYLAVALLAITTMACLVYIFHPEVELVPLAGVNLSLHRKRILAMFTLVIIYVTSLGSNNGLAPIINNMFVVAPFLLWVVFDIVKKLICKENQGERKAYTALKYGASVSAVIIICITLIQSMGFHMNFAIQDGDEGEERTAQITEYPQTKGIYTTKTNADNLQGIMDFVNANCDEVDSVILYDNAPGFGYLLNKRSALSTFWPDLDSFTYSEWTADLENVRHQISCGNAPLIISSIKVAAWEGGDKDAIEYFGIDKKEFEEDIKLNELVELIHEENYTQVYCNDGYAVYMIVE